MENDQNQETVQVSATQQDNSDPMQEEVATAIVVGEDANKENPQENKAKQSPGLLERLSAKETVEEWAHRLSPDFLAKVPLDLLLDVLTPSAVGVYDLPILKIIAWLIHTRQTTVKPYIPILHTLFKAVDQSVALACVREMVYLGIEFSRYYQSQKSYLSAILPLSHAARKASATKDHFTPIHTELFKLCILSKCYSAALPFLHESPCLMSKDFQDNAAESMLLYFYYGGIIYLAVKDYQLAYDTFSLVFVVPCSATSAIHIDCFKKLLLTSLIQRGKPPVIPNCFPSMIARDVADSCKVYEDLSAAFSSSERFGALVQENMSFYQEDGNLGLVKQCLHAISKAKIQELTKTYISLSISDIQSRANLSSEIETESRIWEMVESGQLNAAIDQKSRAVLLKDDDEKYNTEGTLSVLDSQMKKVIHLAHLTKICDDATMLSPEYAKTAVTQERFRTDDLYEEGYA